MRTSLISAMVFLAALAMAGPVSAKVLSGKWGGKSATTLEFVDNNKVKYCFKEKCITRTYTGDKDSKISFNWGRAKLTFTKTATGYDGLYERMIKSTVKVQ